MEEGIGLTVNGVIAIQPVGKVYVILTVPAVMPDTTPEEEPTVATVVLLLVQLPPAEPSVNVVVWPIQTLAVPPIAAGNGFTVTGTKVLHPAGIV